MTIGELHKKLTEDGHITSTRQYLSKLATEGKIPYTMKGKRKNFVYKKVVASLDTFRVKPESPANAKKSLESIPPPKEGQSQEEYKQELKMELGEAPTLADSKTFLTIFQGKIAEQKFDIEAGKLIYREEVEQKAFTVARVIRDQLLTLPERLSGELASSTDPKEIKEIMYKEINQVLTFLHDGEALYD